MANFETAQEVMETSANSAGSAMKEHEKWMQSLDAKINTLKASWQSLSQSFLSSDFLKACLDGVIGLVDGLNKLIDTFGAFPTLMATISACFSLFKNKGLFKAFDNDLEGISNHVGILNKSFAELGQTFKTTFSSSGGGFKGFFDGLKAMGTSLKTPLSDFDKSAIDEYNKLVETGALNTESLNKVMEGTSVAAKSLVNGANGSKVSLNAVNASSLGAAAGMVVAKVAAIALNAALTMGISIAIQFVMEGLMSIINASDELAEKVNEVTSKFKEQSEELQKLKGNYDTTDESSMISKYEKLSKGVDGLGRNVSLTADEYSEYQSIVNSIADQIPSLVSGYDSQGNAILSCKGNVEELVEAYEKLIHVQNQEILSSNADAIEKNWKNIVSQASEYDFWEWIGNSLSLSWLWGSDDLTAFDMKTDTAEWLASLTSSTSQKEIASGLGSWDSYRRAEVIQALQNAGYDVDHYSNISKVLKDALENEPEKIRGILDNYYAQFDDAVAEYKTKATALLREAFDVSSTISGLNYGNIGEELQEIAYQTVNSLDFDFLADLTEQEKTIDQWTKELLNQLNSIDKATQDALSDSFDLQAEFNGGDIDYGDYVDKLREVESIIDSLDLKDEAKTQLKISLGLDENGVVDQYDALMERLTSKEYLGLGLDQKSVEKFLDGLSAEEYSVLVSIIPDLEAGTTIDEIQAMIDEAMALEFKFDIDVETEGIEALNTALAESRSATGLTTESIETLKSRYEDLDSFNAAALFEKTANGIHLNSEELARLEELYANTNKLEIDKQLDTLITKYNELTEEIEACTDAADKEALQLQADNYKDKIEELQILASQYDGLTSAYNKWQNALDGAEEGDNYDTLYENLESIKELYDKGLVGTDKFKTAVQLMSDKDLSTASIEELVSAYEKGYPKMQRYFTEGQQGCKNFLSDISSLNSEWAHMNADGSWEINFNAEEIAKELGVSVDFVLQIAKKLKDYGFEINLDDSSVDSLQTKIEKTEAKLKELGQSPVDINVDIEASSSNLGKIESEIEKAKAKIAEINNSSISPEVKTAQLEDAQAKLEALIDKKQEASQPAFMSLNASQVNASLVEALEKVQDYQNAINELNKLNELKEAGITIDDSEITSAQEKVDECAKAIQGLDGNVKVAIGLEEDGSIDSIKKSFENGEVKLDVNTDLASSKIEQLAENVERIEDKDVTIDVTVKGLKDVKNLVKQVDKLNNKIDLATTIEGDIDKLSEYVEDAKALKELGGNISSYVTANVKGNVIDTFEYKLDNLKVFTDSAKDIEKIGIVKSEVTADVKGNVIDEFEYKIDNLKAYSDSAENIGKIGNVESTVKANIEGNVTDEFEYKINNLKVFSDSAKDIYKIGNVESNVRVTINSGEDGDVIDEFEYKLNNLEKFAEYVKDLQGLQDVDISINATVNTGEDGDVVDEFEYKLDNLGEFANHIKELQGLQGVDISVNATINTGKDGDVIDEFEYKLDNLKKFADHVKDLQSLESVDVSVNATVNTGEDGDAIDTFEYKLNNLETFAEGAKALQGIGNVSSEITAKVNTGETGDAIDTFEYKLNNLETFAEGAKALQGIGDVSTTVTAKINSGEDGDVVDEFEYKIDNLEKFAQYAQDLQGVGDVDVTISAKVNTGEDGDVVDEFEYKLNNLDEFSTYAKELQGLQDVDISIKANISTGEDSVTEEFEYKLNNLDSFADYAKSLQGLESVDITVAANAKGNVVGEKTEGKIDNLEVFAKGAKKVQNIESKSVTITANAKGNVVGKKTERKLDNLEVFGNSAKALNGLSSKEVSITANAYGNVASEKTEEELKNLKTFSNSAKALDGVGSKNISITANADGSAIAGEGASSRLSSLTEFKSLINGMSNQTVTVSVKANVDSENINKAITLLQGVVDSGVFKDYTATVQVGAKIATIDDATVQNYKAPKKEGKVAYSVDSTAVDNWTAPTKDGVVNYSASVEALTDAQKHKTGTITYTPKIKGGLGSLFGVANGTANANGSAFANGTSGKAFKQGDWGVKKTTTALTGELGQELVVYKNKFWTVGDNGAEFATIPKGAIVFNHKQTRELFANGKVTSDGGRGKMFANGTAFANGTGSGRRTWLDSTISKIKEFIAHPMDVIVDTIYGDIDAVGDALYDAFSNDSKSESNGATSVIDSPLLDPINKLKETIDDEVVSVLEKSKNETVNSYLSSVASSSNVGTNTSTSTSSSSSSNSNITGSSSGGFYGNDDDSSSSENDFEDVIDWIEIILDRAERAIDKYEKQADNVYKTWSFRNTALENEISEVGNTIDLYEQAKDEYWSRANSVNLDETYKEMVRSGSFSIEDFKGETDEALVEKIKEYQEWYNKILDCEDAIEDLTETESSLYAQRFEHIQSEYDGILQGFDHTETMLNEYISQAEAKGHIVSKNYYQALINNEKQNINELKKEQSELIKARDEAVASGKIEKYSEEWYDMCADIDSVTQAIESGTTSLLEYAKAIEEIEWSVFDLVQERISDVTSEADFLIDLMSNKKLHNDDGSLTDQGMATMGLHGQNYNSYMYQADTYADEIAELDKQIASDPYNQDLINRRNELLEAQRDCILAAEDEKEAIKSLVEESIELELDSLSELIDKKNEELKSTKDLYEYNKKVKSQTAEISSIQKQLAAYSQDDSEEARKKIQELKVSLEEAEADLEETEYDKYISDQEELLSSLYDEYELTLNTRLDDLDALVSQQIEAVNANASTISTTLTTEASNVGTTLSTAMQDIWATDGAASKVLSTYGSDLSKLTTINTTLSGIKEAVYKMVDYSDTEATDNINSGNTDSSAGDKVNVDNKTTESGNTKNNVTNDTIKGIASAIWVYGNKSGWGNDPFRENKLTNVIGFENAKKVQSYINKNADSGNLYKIWLENEKNLDKYKYSAFASGSKKIDKTQLAWTQENGKEFIVRPSDGAILTPVAKGDSVLTSVASSNIWDMANSPAEFIKDNLNLGTASVPNNANMQTNIVQNLDKVVFNMPNVRNYEELLSEMQKDKKFERLVLSMTVDQIAGKSSLAKGKAIR